HRREKTVALFVDTFNGNFETENVQAALRVLHSAGYSVHIPRAEQGALCCGRTYLATGRLEVARERLAQLTEVLLPLAQAGVPIVGLEPSCVLTLRDEALALGLGEAARTVSTQVYLFEEFVAREAAAGRFAARFGPIDRPILVHGHCHQKAHAAIRPLLDAVALVPGANPQLVETSCCGMAGSFGYEKEHYVLSMQMAEASLLPALRKEPGAIVVASGTSCRHQIADGASREAIHLALFLDQYRSPSR
ncbi:MAG: (Fe-S)-binding protein, partial [Burkholderiaceae bacterium]